MKTKHTPGPWTYNILPSNSFVPIVHCGHLTDGRTKQNWAVTLSRIDYDESEANAHLIAAAPDLLEALELAYAYIGSIQGHADIHNATALYLKLGQSIAKARGES